ncbi:MAG TPA: phosphoribosyltransferase family protein [Xanthomonadales bacterium]|nr:phosphoribosyltransferase family protein [Xanthomonadales bacterium]
MNELIYTWDQFFADSKKLAELIAPAKPKSLIVVTRGGMFLGGLLSEYLDIPIIETISIESYAEREKQLLKVLKLANSELPSPLIVDDIVDTGETMKYVTDKYKVKSAVLFYKPQTAIIKPDYYLHQTDKWVKFPWEVKL